jgi:Flp pilus assembly protein TadG
MQRNRLTNPQRNARNGAYIVELAISLPVIIIVIFATIEICGMYHFRQSLKIAAYQGCRIGITPAGTSALVNAQCQMLLEQRGIENFTINLSQDPSTLATQDVLQVRVSAPTTGNVPLAGWLRSQAQVECSVSMASER